MSHTTVSLRGRVAIVTGAAGGVGRATARVLVREGLQLAITDLSKDAVDALARELGTHVISDAFDVTDRAAFERFVDLVELTFGPADVVCNIAAIMPAGRFESEPDVTAERILAINLGAVIHSTKVLAARMKVRGAGHIVNVASAAGWIAGGGGATYCASKFGVVGYSEAVALELRGTGVEITVIAPSVIETEMAAGLKTVRGMRSVSPEEVADAIVAALKRPRFAVFVPPAIGPMLLLASSLPYRARHALARLTNTDRLLLDLDAEARTGYEARLAAITSNTHDEEM